MRPVVKIVQSLLLLGCIAAIARCGLLLQTWVAWSICHDREPCKNGWTNRDAVMVWDPMCPVNCVFDGGPDLHTWRSNFEDEKGRPRTCPAVSDRPRVFILKVTQQEAAPVRRGCRTLIDGLHICATWQIRSNRLCASAMRFYVKLLWPVKVLCVREAVGTCCWYLVVRQTGGWWGEGGARWRCGTVRLHGGAKTHRVFFQCLNYTVCLLLR